LDSQFAMVSQTVKWASVACAASISLSGCGGGATSTPAPTTSTPAPMTSTPAPMTWEEMVHAGTPPTNLASAPTEDEYETALANLNLDDVKADVVELLSTSHDSWPSDSGSYIGFMVRLAWHSSGSYRKSDNKGGVGGGRQRFEPETSWPDNVNLDKARALLAPIKAKYGDGLSWGDLFIVAGSTALREAGMPLKQICFGRMDDADGSKSELLGPTQLQAETFPCKDEAGNILDAQDAQGNLKVDGSNGECFPNKANVLGSTTIGLIYLNPEGPMGEPDPAKSVGDIKRAFGLMGHTEKNTVALIGAHALGKSHGACDERKVGAGKPPNEAYAAGELPYQSPCGESVTHEKVGSGKFTVSAGFEGPWTSRPSTWDNEYFQNLVKYEWEKWVGPGGHWQWRISNSTDERMMLTSDLALLQDPFRQYVDEFAADMDKFNAAFEDGWNDLTMIKGGGTWAKTPRCDSGSFPEEARGMLGTDPLLV